MFENFFLEIDEKWSPCGSEPIILPIIGCSALVLQCDYYRGTKDNDILEIGNITPDITKSLEALAGKGSILAQRHKLYLDIVGAGIPFLPQSPHFHPLKDFNGHLKNFNLKVLDVTDVVVSKLMTFRAQDVEDIKHVVDMSLVKPKKLMERFLSAVEIWSLGSRAKDLPKYIENLHTVERDFLGVKESCIELPSSWLG